MINKITVFTPTYNRAELLKRSYEAMKRQTNQDFNWIIIDDGSTDNTEFTVEAWLNEEHIFHLEYYYKPNGGLQSCYIEALKHIDTELCFCVDSDDYLCDDAIETILSLWENHCCEPVAGIMALDKTYDGTVLGGLIKNYNDGDHIDLLDISIRHKIRRADQMLIIRTELYKKATPAKTYKNERTINATYLHLQIARDNKFLLLNRPICIVEYLLDGRTHNKKRDYVRCPNTYADWRLLKLSFKDLVFKEKCTQNIHYIAECMIAKRKVLKDSPTKLLTILLLLPGFLLYLYLIMYNNRSQ